MTGTSNEDNIKSSTSVSNATNTDCRLHVGTKKHWGDIYVQSSPMLYYTTMTPYDYGFFHDRFLELFSGELDRHFSRKERVEFVEVGSSYGNTTLGYKCGLDWEATGRVWADGSLPLVPIRDLHVTAVDMSAPALTYGESRGIFDRIVVHDFNAPAIPDDLLSALASADVLVLIMISSYIRTLSFQRLVLSFLGDRSKKKVLAYNDTCAFDTRNLSPEALFAGIKGWTGSQHFFKHRNFTEEESALRHGCKESWSYTYIVTFEALEYDNRYV